MRKKTENRTEALEKTIFSRSLNLILEEIGAAHVREILQASLYLETQSHKDKWVERLFFRLFQEVHCQSRFSAAVKNCSRY